MLRSIRLGTDTFLARKVSVPIFSFFFFVFGSLCFAATDTTPPTGTIKINNDAVYTNSITVNLSLSATDTGSGMGTGAQMQFSSDNKTWWTPVAYAVTKSWIVGPGDGTKTVYVKFKDVAGNWSQVYSDAIILDFMNPAAPTVTDEGQTTQKSDRVYASWVSSKPVSGIAEFQYQIRQDAITGSVVRDWTSVGTNTSVTATGLNLQNGKVYYFAVKVKNGAGSWSMAGNSDGIKVVTTDTAPPTGTIKINNDAQYTSAVAVILNLSATDAGSGMGTGSQMQFSNDNKTWSTAEAYVATKSWNLVSGDGAKTVYVKFKDVAGNWSGAYSDTIILDTVKPATPVVTDNGATTASTTTLNASWTSSDATSGIAEYQYKITQDSVTGTVIVDWTSTGTAVSITSNGLKLAVGKTYYFAVKAKDKSGLWSDVGQSDGIKVVASDTTPPIGTVIINNGASYTNIPSTTLTLSCTDSGSGMGAGAQMQFSLDNQAWSTPEAYVTTKTITINALADGLKTVYVKFKDVAGNWSQVYSDTIIYDTTLPTTPIVTDEGQTTQKTNQLFASWTSEDKESGIALYQYRITQDSISGTAIRDWTSVAKATSITANGLSLQDNKTYFIAVKAQNGVGLWSNVGYSDGIKKISSDTTAPTGTIKINNDAQYTSVAAVTLNLSATDAGSGMGAGSQMQFSGDNTTWSSPEAYAVTKAWTLASGDGTKTVYVKFKDVAGNWSSAYSDTIILDTVKPVTPVVTDNGATTASTTTLNVSWTSSDATSGIAEYQYRITQDSAAGTVIVDWTSVGTATSVTKAGLALVVDKTYYFSVKAKDKAGLWSDVGQSDGIKVVVVDTTPPTGTIKINNDAQYTSVAAVTLNLSATDAGSGMGAGAQMQFSNDNKTWSAAEAYAVTKNWTLAAGNGTKTVYVKFKDVAGNWSQAYSDTIVLDAAVPAGTVIINNGASYTNIPSVALTLSCTDSGSGMGAGAQMQFSLDNQVWSTPEAYATTKTIIINALVDGLKTVYVKFKDVVGNWSSAYSDTIMYDATPPTTPTVTDEGQATQKTNQLFASWASEDKESGIVEFQYQITQDSATGPGVRGWTSVGTNTSVTATGLTLQDDKAYYFGVKAKNGVGAWSTVGYSDGIKKVTVDTTTPTGTIKINNDAQYASVAAVTLNLSATDAGSGMGAGAQMQFSNDNKTWSAAEAYAVTKNWTLAAGNGTKTVYVKFKDVAGNWSVAYSDTIVLDAALPTGTIQINNNAAITNSMQVTLTLSASDSSGVIQMQLSNDGVNWSNPGPYSTSKPWALASGDGTKTVYVKFKDNAENWSSVYSDSIILDTVSPAGTIKINNDAQYINAVAVTLNLSATDAGSGMGAGSQMQFSNDNTNWSNAEAYAVSKAWTLASGDGTKTVYVKFKDVAGNWSSAYSDTIILDAIKPVTPVVTDAGVDTSSIATLNASWTSSDATSGIAEYQYKITKDSVTGAVIVDWVSVGTATSVTKAGLTLVVDKIYYFSVKAKDKSGLWSDVGQSDGIKVVAADTVAPTGTIKINSDAQYTNVAAVTLNLSATDAGSGMGAGAEMQFSNDNTNWSNAEVYAVSKAWTVASGDGTKTVYVKFKDVAGNWSSAYSDTIILDVSAPVTPTITDEGQTTLKNDQLYASWASSDAVSGIAEFQYQITQDSATGPGVRGWTSVGTNTSVTATGLTLQDDKVYYFGVKAKNGAGAWSGAGYSDGIKKVAPDTTAPTGTIKINGDTQYTNVVAATLTLSAQDNSGGSGMGAGSQMQFSADNSSWSAAEAYAVSKAWTLATGDGTKTVYVKFKDVVGNWSAVYSDTIVFDTTAPSGTILVNNGDASTDNWDVALKISVTDAGSGMGAGAEMQFSNDNSNWSAAEAFAVSKAWKLASGSGAKTVYAKFKDALGNWSGSISDAINVAVVPKERIYVYLNGQRVAMEETSGGVSKKYFYHNDHLGSTSVVTDISGAQVKYLEYKPYGETKVEEGSLAVKKKFTGKELDDSTGLYDYGARMYDAKLARFITADTINPDLANPQSLNRYAYCLNNPLKYVDPTGHVPIDYVTYDAFFMALDLDAYQASPNIWNASALVIDAYLYAVPYIPAVGGLTIRAGVKAFSRAGRAINVEKQIIKFNSKASRYYNAVTGKFTKVDWEKIAPNEGFLTKAPGKAKSGQIVDRYGPSKGNYLSPEGTPYSQRGIPEGFTEYHKYEVLKPFDWMEGTAREVKDFGSIGGGKQFKTSKEWPIKRLEKEGFLKELK